MTALMVCIWSWFWDNCTKLSVFFYSCTFLLVREQYYAFSDLSWCQDKTFFSYSKFSYGGKRLTIWMYLVSEFTAWMNSAQSFMTTAFMWSSSQFVNLFFFWNELLVFFQGLWCVKGSLSPKDVPLVSS